MNLSAKDRGELVKILNMTTSNNDNEALVAIRKANEVVKRHGVLWDAVIVASLEDNIPSFLRRNSGMPPARPQSVVMMEDILDEEISDTTREFIESLMDYWRTWGRLTPKQFAAMKKVYRRHVLKD